MSENLSNKKNLNCHTQKRENLRAIINFHKNNNIRKIVNNFKEIKHQTLLLVTIYVDEYSNYF